MTKEEFKAIVDDSVKNGNTREAAEAFVIAGFALDAKEFATKVQSSTSKSPKAKK